MTPRLPYRFVWDRMGRRGQACRLLVRGGMTSCLIEFADGYRAVTSRNALRRIQPAPKTAPQGLKEGRQSPEAASGEQG